MIFLSPHEWPHEKLSMPQRDDDRQIRRQPFVEIDRLGDEAARPPDKRQIIGQNQTQGIPNPRPISHTMCLYPRYRFVQMPLPNELWKSTLNRTPVGS